MGWTDAACARRGEDACAAMCAARDECEANRSMRAARACGVRRAAGRVARSVVTTARSRSGTRAALTQTVNIVIAFGRC